MALTRLTVTLESFVGQHKLFCCHMGITSFFIESTDPSGDGIFNTGTRGRRERAIHQTQKSLTRRRFFHRRHSLAAFSNSRLRPGVLSHGDRSQKSPSWSQSNSIRVFESIVAQKVFHLDRLMLFLVQILGSRGLLQAHEC